MSTHNLYPVVQDLTDVEYGHGCCCCDSMLSSFSLKDLAVPVATPRTLTPTGLKSKERVREGKNSDTTHRRGHSLFGISSPSSRFPKERYHRRSHSTLSTSISEDSCSQKPKSCPDLGAALEDSCSSSLYMESEERVTVDNIKFEESFVLTRQVSTKLFDQLHCGKSSLFAIAFIQIYRCNISTIWECIHRENGTRHCVKVIDRRRFTSRTDEDSALKEIALLTALQKVDSPRLVEVVTVSEDLHHFYIVMNFVEGGNLASLLSRDSFIGEQRVQQFARSLLEGVAQLHSISVCHNDLQPDNILLKSNDEVVLCDFGCASYVDGDSSSASTRNTKHGNLAYTPPEVILRNTSHGFASDMWSVGIILFHCLVGYLPFEDGSKRRLREKIVRAEYDFNQKEWHFVSRGAKQFLSSLLHPDPQVRMTVSEALVHPWLSTLPVLVPKRSRRSLVRRIWGQWNKRKLPKANYLYAATADLSIASTLTSFGSMEESTKRKYAVERLNMSM